MKGLRADNVSTKMRKLGNKEYLYLVKANEPKICFKNTNTYFCTSRDLRLLLEYCTGVIKSYTHSTGAVSYIANLNKGVIYHSPHKLITPKHLVTFRIETGKTLAAHVAWAKEIVVVNDLLQDERFPLGVAWKDSIRKRAMCLPVLTPSREVVAVLELTKDMGEGCYTIDELEAALTLVNWIGATIQNAYETQVFLREKQMNKYILQLINLYYTTNITAYRILSEILLFSKRALNAVKCMFYILYKNNDDYIVDIYDEESSGHKFKSYFMLSRSETIAAYVARTGRIVSLNTRDIQLKFDTSVYQGIILRSVLAAPVQMHNNVIGVIEIINKREAYSFSNEDERIFKLVASYCQMVLTHHIASTNLKELENWMEIYDELLSLHMHPCEHDMNELVTSNLDRPENLFTPTYYPELDIDSELCKISKFLFLSVMGKSYNKQVNLDKFLLLIAKLHPEDEYLNFQHTFCSFHTVANIIYNNSYDFTVQEKEDMLIAALIHTFDHRGYSFTSDEPIPTITSRDSDIPLRLSFYFIIRVFKNCNIYQNIIYRSELESKLSSLYGLIRACSIKNTMQERHDLYWILMEDHFDWNNSDHRNLKRSLVMLISEYSYCYKYPLVAINTYRKKLHSIKDSSIYKDCSTVYSINRDSNLFIAQEQLEYLKMMIIPFLHLLLYVFPNTEDHIVSCHNLLNEWQTIVNRFEDPVWEPELSYPRAPEENPIEVEKLCSMFKQE